MFVFFESKQRLSHEGEQLEWTRSGRIFSRNLPWLHKIFSRNLEMIVGQHDVQTRPTKNYTKISFPKKY